MIDGLHLCVEQRSVDGSPHPDVLRAMEAAVQLRKQELVQRAEEELYHIQSTCGLGMLVGGSIHSKQYAP